MQKHIFIDGMTINASKIQRDVRNGHEVVVLKDTLAMTLPSVMNRKLYTRELFANHYQELSDVLAPVSHPKKSSGELLPAGNPIAVNEFHGGASNENPRLMDDGRVLVDIVINVDYAGMVPKGQELMAVVNAIESGQESYLATSTGLFYAANAEKGNLNGKEYDSVITACKFDHNAILINEQPAGELCGFTANNEVVEQVSLMDSIDNRKPSLFSKVKCYFGANSLTTEQVYNQLSSLVDGEITSISNDSFVVNGETKNYEINSDIITVLNKTDAENPEMEAQELKALLAEQAETIMAANAEATTTAMAPLSAKIAELEAQLAANTDKELSTKRDAVKAKFGLTDEAVKEIGVNALDSMYAQTVGASPIAANSFQPETGGEFDLSDMEPAA